MTSFSTSSNLTNNLDTMAMYNDTIKYSGDGGIFIQPFCDFFQIHYKNQLKVIYKTPILKTSVAKKRSMLLFGDERERITLTKQGFITWILKINTKIVQVNLRDKLQEYQSLIFDFMFGSMEREAKVKVVYARLKKMTKLYSKLGSEIASSKRFLHSYMDGRFVQTSLQFNEKRKLN